MESLQATVSACIALLEEFRRLLEAQTTACYVHDLFSVVPAHWLDAVEALPFQKLLRLREHVEETGHSELIEFCNRTDRLKPNFELFVEEEEPQDLETWGMSPKKKHEVRRLAAYIKQLAESLHVTGCRLGSRTGLLVPLPEHAVRTAGVGCGRQVTQLARSAGAQ